MAKQGTITGRVRDVSSISHLVYHNGKPCDMYTATVKICQTGYTGAGFHSWYLVLYADTEQELEYILDDYRIEERITVPVDNLVDKRGCSYGKTRD